MRPPSEKRNGSRVKGKEFTNSQDARDRKKSVIQATAIGSQQKKKGGGVRRKEAKKMDRRIKVALQPGKR